MGSEPRYLCKEDCGRAGVEEEESSIGVQEKPTLTQLPKSGHEVMGMKTKIMEGAREGDRDHRWAASDPQKPRSSF